MKSSKMPILILHGWGLSGDKYKNLVFLLRHEGYLVFTPDLPGFGKEPLINKNMNLSDYVDFVDKVVDRNDLNNFIIIGHSFGGRVAIKYAYLYPQKVSKIILTGVPIVRNSSFGRRVAFILAVAGNKIFQKLPKLKKILQKVLYSLIGEWDYYRAGMLRETLKNIIVEDLLVYLKKIKNPTLLVWGEDDRITPVSNIRKIEKDISSFKLITVPSSSHKLPYENPEGFLKNIKSFL